MAQSDLLADKNQCLDTMSADYQHTTSYVQVAHREFSPWHEHNSTKIVRLGD